VRDDLTDIKLKPYYEEPDIVKNRLFAEKKIDETSCPKFKTKKTTKIVQADKENNPPNNNN
jgi:hypothetical protein